MFLLALCPPSPVHSCPLFGRPVSLVCCFQSVVSWNSDENEKSGRKQAPSQPARGDMLSVRQPFHLPCPDRDPSGLALQGGDPGDVRWPVVALRPGPPNWLRRGGGCTSLAEGTGIQDGAAGVTQGQGGLLACSLSEMGSLEGFVQRRPLRAEGPGRWSGENLSLKPLPVLA